MNNPRTFTVRCPSTSGHEYQWNPGPELKEIPDRCPTCGDIYTTDQRIDIWEAINAKATAKVNA